MVQEQVSESKTELVLVKAQETTTINVAMAAVFAALSVAVAPVARFLPRLQWGIALFDPVSIFWLCGFLLGGIPVGLVCLVAGTIGLFFFDPTLIGPLFKAVATAPFMLVPYLFARKVGSIDGIRLGETGLYLKAMIIAYVIRLALMLPINLTIVPLLWGISDLNFIAQYTIILNTVQSFWDALIPFLVIHRSGIFARFKTW